MSTISRATESSFSLHTQRRPLPSFSASSATTSPSQRPSPLVPSSLQDIATEHLTLPQQWYATSADSAPPEPDILRLLLTLARNNVRIAPIAEVSTTAAASAPPRSGSFSDVRIGEWTPPSRPAVRVALKSYKALRPLVCAPGSDAAILRARAMHDLLFELEIMARCRHQNVARVLGVTFDEAHIFPSSTSASASASPLPTVAANADFFIAPILLLEPAMAETPDLASYLDSSRTGRGIVSVNLEARIDLVKGIARGLAALHSLGVVHADLKPENVLLFPAEDGFQRHVVPKITDFGMSGLSTSRDAPRGGTELWNSPECLKSAGEKMRAHATKSPRDVYSFGLVTYFTLMQGLSLFCAMSTKEAEALRLDKRDCVAMFAIESSADELEGSTFEVGIGKLFWGCLRLNPEERWKSVARVEEIFDIEPRQKSKEKGSWRKSVLTRWRPNNGKANSKENIKTDTSPNQEEFLPFGTTKLGGKIVDHDRVALLTMNQVYHTFNTPDTLPANLRLALSQQLYHMILTTPDFPTLPFAYKRAALMLLSSEMLEALYLARPEYKIFALTMPDAVIAVYRQMAVDQPETVQDFVLSCNDVHLNALKVYAGMASPTEICAARDAALKLSDTHLMIYMGINTILAAARGSLGSMRQLAAPFGWTPLHSAVLTDCVETVKFVLGKGGDVNAPLAIAARYTLTPLHLAVVLGRVKFVEVLLKVQGVDVRTRDYGRFGVTPSHTCADFKSAKQLEILSILLAHDSTLVRARDEDNRTPLHHAALWENLPAVKLLIQHGAEIDALDVRGSTPLHLAYMAANGWQSSDMIQPPDEREGVIRIMHPLTLPPGTIEKGGKFAAAFETGFAKAIVPPPSPSSSSSSSSSPPARPPGSMIDILRLLFPVYKRIVSDETPPGHDAFLLFRRTKDPVVYDAVLAFYDDAARSRRDNDAAGGPRALDLELAHLPGCLSVRPDVGEIEMNISKFVDVQRRSAYFSSHYKEKQFMVGETYIRSADGRQMLRLLLRKGADPARLNALGEAPEAWAYCKQDLSYSLRVPLDDSLISYEPKRCFIISECPMIHTPAPILLFDIEAYSQGGLFVAPFKGDWTIWTWLQDVLPCPSDLILLVVAQRFSTMAAAVDVGSQKVIVEVQMHPPNDLHNSTKTLLRQEWLLIELLPRPNEPFVLRLGDIPLKHKATLLVNLRSSNPPGSVVAPFAITSITLRARQFSALDEPLSSTPKRSSSIPSSSAAASLIHPLLRAPVETVALPRFRHGAHWHACPAQPSKPNKFIPLSIHRSRQNAIIKEETAELTLKSPNPLLYTRPVVSTSESDEKTYGPKTWHYPLTAGNVSYEEMRMFSDGIEGVRAETNQVIDQAANIFGGDSEQFRQIKGRMEGAFAQLLIALQEFDDDKTSALFGVSRSA